MKQKRAPDGHVNRRCLRARCEDYCQVGPSRSRICIRVSFQPIENEPRRDENREIRSRRAAGSDGIPVAPREAPYAKYPAV